MIDENRNRNGLRDDLLTVSSDFPIVGIINMIIPKSIEGQLDLVFQIGKRNRNQLR